MRNLFADGKFKRNFFGFEQNFVNFLFRVIGKRKQMFFSIAPTGASLFMSIKTPKRVFFKYYINNYIKRQGFFVTMYKNAEKSGAKFVINAIVEYCEIRYNKL